MSFCVQILRLQIHSLKSHFIFTSWVAKSLCLLRECHQSANPLFDYLEYLRQSTQKSFTILSLFHPKLRLISVPLTNPGNSLRAPKKAATPGWVGGPSGGRLHTGAVNRSIPPTDSAQLSASTTVFFRSPSPPSSPPSSPTPSQPPSPLSSPPPSPPPYPPPSFSILSQSLSPSHRHLQLYNPESPQLNLISLLHFVVIRCSHQLRMDVHGPEVQVIPADINLGVCFCLHLAETRVLKSMTLVCTWVTTSIFLNILSTNFHFQINLHCLWCETD